MNNEIKNFIQVWISVFFSLCYCYFISAKIPKGKIRLLSIFPIISLFFLLPLHLSSIHLCGGTAFFIAWLANFKLLLFSFNKGPLSSNPPISFLYFISIASLPIKIQQNPQNPSLQINKKSSKSPLNYAIKALILALLIRLYNYREFMHPKFILCLYCFHVYFLAEIMLAMVATLARTVLGLELEPQFDEPYLSTSLQDFWGKRWNLMVTSILRPTVYDPTRGFCTRILGTRRRWAAALPAVVATFVVSGVMHELLYFYVGRVEPTWEVTWFFILHGFCLVAEIAAKKVIGGRWWWLLRVVAPPLTVGFVVVTGSWLFFPQLLRCGADVRAFGEYAALVEFVKENVRALSVWVFSEKSA